MSIKGKYRWFVVAVFFVFMLLHQADKLLIGPLTTPIMEYFDINEAQMGVVFSGALLVGGIFYPLWGYLYDRYARSKLLSLASFVWGATTWLSALAKTFPVFVITRASTGIDDASYPGLYSLISDYFSPKERGRIYGLLQIAMPLGYIIGTILAITLAARWHWQGVFYLTGSLGVLLAAVIFFGVKEMPRGGAEPEFEGLETISTYRFDLKTALGLFKKRSLQFLFLQGFFGSFPWQVITFWFFRYLETERGFNSTEIMTTMIAAVLFLAAGYPIGGALEYDLYGVRSREYEVRSSSARR
jgi:MFS family permease